MLLGVGRYSWGIEGRVMRSRTEGKGQFHEWHIPFQLPQVQLPSCASGCCTTHGPTLHRTSTFVMSLSNDFSLRYGQRGTPNFRQMRLSTVSPTPSFLAASSLAMLKHSASSSRVISDAIRPCTARCT